MPWVLMITIKGLKPVSVNKYKTPIVRGKHVTMILSKEARQYKEAVQAQLYKQREYLNSFDINPEKESLSIEVIHYYPKEIFYTKTGKLSIRKGDWDGTIKILQDCIFEFINGDDILITDGVVKQRPGDEYMSTIEISARDSP
jgi:Holliday junction resolvase RusA-like endonuclease